LKYNDRFQLVSEVMLSLARTDIQSFGWLGELFERLEGVLLSELRAEWKRTGEHNPKREFDDSVTAHKT